MPGTRLLAAACAGALVQSQIIAPSLPAPSTLLTVPLRDTQLSRSATNVASLSADGRYAAFTSLARLAPADTDDIPDIYVLDRSTGAVTLESVSADGQPVEGGCGHPGLSGDGRHLVFETAMVGLGPGISSIVLRDRATDIARHLGRTRDGTLPMAMSTQPAISEDGRFVVFASNATSAKGTELGPRRDVYMYSAADGTLARVSVEPAGAQPSPGQSVQPRVSADGRFVVFASSADLLGRRAPVEAASSGTMTATGLEPYQVFVRDMHRQVTQYVSLAPGGRWPDGPSLDPAISGDGRYIAFTSHATNLVRRDRNRSSDVFLYDAVSGELTLVSRSVAGGTGNGSSSAPALSADGRLLVFQSDASDLVCARKCRVEHEDIDLVADVFLMDRQAGLVTEVSRSADAWAEESVSPTVDGRGAVIAFASRHPMDEQDLAHDLDLFVSLSPHGSERVHRRVP
jgi:Tol biopolymer transport system component